MEAAVGNRRDRKLAALGIASSAMLLAACGVSSPQYAAGDSCEAANQHFHDDASNTEYVCVANNGELRLIKWEEPTNTEPQSSATGNPDEVAKVPTPLLESLPIDVRAVNWADVVKFKTTYSGGGMQNFPLLPFGLEESPGGQRDPQPGFYAPLGTDVLAPVTAKVVVVKQLEHGDWTIMFAPAEKGSDYWETEHVIAVKVKVGDLVKAGQPVAKISDVDCQLSKAAGNDVYCRTGLGLVELGYLVGDSQQPTHLCPFEDKRIDPANMQSLLADYLWALDQSENAFGKKYMDRSKWQTPHCEVLSPIYG